MQNAPSSRNALVRLNVGGTLYTTNVQTLVMRGGMLARLFNGEQDNGAHDDDGRIFIDRDGAAFAVVLTYLRTGVALVPCTVSVSAACCELKYFFPGECVYPATPGMLQYGRSIVGQKMRERCARLRINLAHSMTYEQKFATLSGFYMSKHDVLPMLASEFDCFMFCVNVNTKRPCVGQVTWGATSFSLRVEHGNYCSEQDEHFQSNTACYEDIHTYYDALHKYLPFTISDVQLCIAMWMEASAVSVVCHSHEKCDSCLSVDISFKRCPSYMQPEVAAAVETTTCHEQKRNKKTVS